MIKQGTPEWFAQRLGKVTASRVSEVVSQGRGGKPSVMRANYMAELIVERLTGVSQDKGFTSAAMDHGTETEPQARAAYEFQTGAAIEEVPMIKHPAIPLSGASPDGLVDEQGLVEIKCPTVAVHMANLQGKPIEKKYRDQMAWQMACTERLWCDYVSFDPRYPPSMQLHVQRIHRDDDYIKELERGVCQFLTELEAKQSELVLRYGQKNA